MVIWLIGKSGAGKTTVGRHLVAHMRRKHGTAVLLDGDILRDVWGDKLGHDVAGRAKNAHRISHLSRMLHEQDIPVVASVLSIFPEWQKWNRDNIASYFEVFLDVPMSVLRERRALYGQAERGEIENVVGVDIPFPTPPYADLTLCEPEVLQSPEEISTLIMAALD